MLNYTMMTPWAKKLNPESPLPEYPRPSLKRDSFLNLNGMWEYAIHDTMRVPMKYTGNILVPYPIESALSGVRMDMPKDKYLCYHKEFMISKDFIKEVTMLHFGAVNQVSDVYVNGNYLMHHNGGHLPFSIDVSMFVREGKNTIDVVVENKPNYNYCLGKEGHKRGGMWYTKTTGIWQTVWMESMAKKAIQRVTFKTNIYNGSVHVKIDSLSDFFHLEVYYKDTKLISIDETEKEFDFKIKNPYFWDLEYPNLYRVVVFNEYDHVETYFAFREFKAHNGRFYLNGNPIFLNGVLDQGYFSDGIYTPATYEAYEADIKLVKSMGFNCVRKHIKLEPEMFYYLADTLGILVLQDFPNTGKYSFLKDTVLPTIGMKKRNDTRKMANPIRKRHFMQSGMSIMDLLYPHPSVVYYTIFNEGWGQMDSDEMYRLFKHKDESRVIDSTSGWFKQKLSDVESLHVYFRKVKLPKEWQKRPIILSEFGGYSYQEPEHSFNPKKIYGYKKLASKEELTEALIALYQRDVLGLISDGLAGAIYTELSDIEDETNGLITYDRQVIKVDTEKLRELLKDIAL